MAATDTFETTIDRFLPADRELLGEYISQIRSQMQTARSEDARLRILEVFLREAYERMDRNRV